MWFYKSVLQGPLTSALQMVGINLPYPDGVRKDSWAVITWAIWIGLGAATSHSGKAHPNSHRRLAVPDCSNGRKVRTEKGLAKV